MLSLASPPILSVVTAYLDVVGINVTLEAGSAGRCR